MNGKQLPEAFVAQMRETLGDEEAERLFEGLDGQPVVSVRRNARKWNGAIEGEHVPWCSTGYYLDERPLFTADPLFHAGAYYVQEASSMFVEQIVRQHAALTPDTIALDLCAAPGGKSTLLRSLLPEGALLVCNEPMPKRAQILAENMTKWGDPDVIVTQSLPSAFTAMTDTFDLIVTDVPCSGEGMFRKDEVAIAEWSPANVLMCQRRQREILTDIWPALRPGGVLIYSTCTFNRLEDEDNVAWISTTLGADILPIAHDSHWHITPGTDNLGCHFYPGLTRGEGFFCAALRKHGEPTAVDRQNNSPAPVLQSSPNAVDRQNNSEAPAPQAKPDAADRQNNSPAPTPFARIKTKAGDCALRTSHHPLLRQLQLTTRVILSGVRLGEDTKKGFVPDTALALSTALPNLEQTLLPTIGQTTLSAPYPRVELSLKEALAYLHGEALRLAPDTPRGHIIVTYDSLPLGFAKNIGSRANNLYPDYWRIRKEIRV